MLKAYRVVYAMCCLKITSAGFLNNSLKKLTTAGKIIIMVTASVQNHAAVEIVQPNINNSKRHNGTRLRRRLSNIFHFDRAERGFLRNFPSGPLTKGNTQPAICQSPLIHRCRRCISVSYRNGYSSYNCTSVINPDRA